MITATTTTCAYTDANKVLASAQLDTPLGTMLAISDEHSLYLLEFVDRRALKREIERLTIKMKASIVPGITESIKAIEAELKSYFAGTLTEFKTPLHLLGSEFQKLAWTELTRIPYGTTRSYLEQAERIGKPTACRAVANANGANRIAIVIPCHRIINSSGQLGGYGGGIERKRWLLEHERRFL